MLKELQFNLNRKKEYNTFKITTLGCKVNQYESMAAKSSLIEAGYREVGEKEKSDIVIVNTCSVTHVADKKSRQTIRKLISKNEEAIVMVMGCYAQLKPDEVESIDGVDIVIGTEGKSKIVEILKDYISESSLPSYPSSKDSFLLEKYEEINTNYHPDMSRAFIKVQDGCNMFCTYCIIPYARGKIRSRKISDILSEVDYLTKSNYKELVLTGIHLSSYGLDCRDKYDENYGLRLIDLIETIAEKSPDMRIRIGSLEPGIITKDFARRIANIPNICDQFHLSLQSGSDTILKSMNRRYDSETYKQAVKFLREEFENPAITSDVIVGFPGETEELFQETVDFCSSIGFANLHVFPYSEREGTKAASMRNKLQKNIKSQRVNVLLALADRMEVEYLKSLIGSEQEIIIEKTKSGILGRCKNYSPVYFDNSQISYGLNSENILKCKIVDIENKKLKGVL